MPVNLTLASGVGFREIVPAEHGAQRIVCSFAHTYALCQGSSTAQYLDDSLAYWRLFPCADETVTIGKIRQGESCCQDNSSHSGDLTKLWGWQALPMQAAAGAATCRTGGREPCSEGTAILPFWKGLWSGRHERVFRYSGWTAHLPAQTWHCGWRGFPFRLKVSTFSENLSG